MDGFDCGGVKSKVSTATLSYSRHLIGQTTMAYMTACLRSCRMRLTQCRSSLATRVGGCSGRQQLQTGVQVARLCRSSSLRCAEGAGRCCICYTRMPMHGCLCQHVYGTNTGTRTAMVTIRRTPQHKPLVMPMAVTQIKQCFPQHRTKAAKKPISMATPMLAQPAGWTSRWGQPENPRNRCACPVR